MKGYIGIDIGTSGVKCLVADAAGRVLAVSRQGYEVSRPRPAWAEQHPDEWWRAAAAAVKEAVQASGLPPEDAAAIGLTGQMHGLVMLEAGGAPAAPAILWSDTRSAGQAERLKREYGARLTERAGGPVAAGFLAASLAWVKEESPALFGRIRHVLSPKDYVRYRCTNRIASDPTDACATGAYLPASSAWNRELLAAEGLPEEWFPPVSASAEPAGFLREDAAAELGLPAGLPVITGCGDLQASALGLGIMDHNQLLVNVGTGGQVLQLIDSFSADALGRYHTSPYPDGHSYHVTGAMLAAGLSLSWAAALLGGGLTVAERMDASAGYTACGERLYYLPYLAGERTPYMDSSLRAGFAGMAAGHGPDHLFRAVMEGVGFALLNCYAAVRERCAQAVVVRAGGGPFHSSPFRQLVADMFGLAVEFADQPHSTAYGAAMLACSGTEDIPVRRLAGAWVQPGSSTQPDMERHRLYVERFEDFRRLSSAVNSGG